MTGTLEEIVRAKILTWVGHVAYSQPDYSQMDHEVGNLADEIIRAVKGAPCDDANREELTRLRAELMHAVSHHSSEHRNCSAPHPSRGEGLRPILPPVKPEYSLDQSRAYAAGWNDCLDALGASQQPPQVDVESPEG